MITCKLIGKLGNHMYQTAATIKVAENLNTDFVLPTKSHAGHYGDVPVDFSGFSYDFKQKDIDSTNKFFQPSFGYTPINLQDNLELNGFYQCYPYFDTIRDKLINTYYKFKDEVIELASTYKIGPNSLGVSVRRGDYLWLQHNHCVLSIKYYQDALDVFPDIDEIFIFSDDMPWCKDTFGDDVTYVESDKFAQMYLMTQVKHLILSNSTFAWWGGYLNNKGGKIIIPDPWFGPANHNLDSSGLYYPSWTKLKHEIVTV